MFVIKDEYVMEEQRGLVYRSGARGVRTISIELKNEGHGSFRVVKAFYPDWPGFTDPFDHSADMFYNALYYYEINPPIV
eukprot:CAMPEP_0170556806 /NCGR_PEP_ID=MMETSP0211-20121228/18763_1 /TAXON_ID=311385 /ORGANISM="Pseudokeronopsis sp., Strain OXSARD2" /LENGTH=78 /DNA_ID=CAMNT_0010867357 /DNA_START=193 /DNA_END=429 /DNA_ORIENTATION=+